MDTALLVTTILSLAAALVSMLAVRRMKYHDERRLDARVAALAAAALDDRPASIGNGPSSIGHRPSAIVDRQRAIVNGRPTLDDRRSPIDDRRLFGTVQREMPASGRFAFAAAAALIVALGGAVVVFTTSGHNREGASVAAAAHAAPLELVSLGHSREHSTLTITGMVRNPPGGPRLEELTAVVSLIDTHGGLISTKDVPLDYHALGPGEEAPFTVTVPDSGSVARYRVSFRAGTDVVPHVDRRSDTKLASAL